MSYLELISIPEIANYTLNYFTNIYARKNEII